MEDFLFSLNIILPLAALMALGYFFHQIGLFSDAFIRQGKKLCFYALLSSTLFKNLYDTSLAQLNMKLVIFVVIAILLEYLSANLIARKLSDERKKIGVIVQGAMRSNYAYISIPLASLMFSDPELLQTTTSRISLLSAFVIPLFNILAVIALSRSDETGRKSLLKKTIRNILTNPCIDAIFAGLIVLVIRFIFPQSAFFIKDQLPFLYKVLTYFAQMSTPLALLLVGASLSFSRQESDRRILLWVTALKNLIYPAVILLAAVLLMSFETPDYAVLAAVFGAPTAIASAIMAYQLKADDKLANEIVVYTTVFSSFSLLLIVFLLRTGGLI